MEKKRREGLRLDPRAGLLLLALANVIMLVQDDPEIQISWIGCLTMLYLLCGRIKNGFQWLFVYLVLCAFQWMVLPAAPGVVISCFSIFINYARRMYPCMMIGWLILKTVSLREFIVALRTLHVPQTVIIPISVTLRYFPAIREESGYIRDAMKLKNLHGGEKVEAFVVPLMMSAVNTAEELAAAAVTRGIENPVKKTSTVRLHIGVMDCICILVAAGFLVAALAV